FWFWAIEIPVCVGDPVVGLRRQRKVANRPLGGCVFGERSKPKTEGAENVLVFSLPKTTRVGVVGARLALVPMERKTHRQNQTAQNVGCVGFADACWRSSCRRAIMIYWRRNRPAVGYPPYVCRHVLAFSSNLFGAITHRGGRDARVPVLRRFAAIVVGAISATNNLDVSVPLVRRVRRTNGKKTYQLNVNRPRWHCRQLPYCAV
ncbi:MAG: hypothetical protein LBQ66_14040, partial [Planctomycetaceae bacterium]|nr:hypothetical protein [Planctomycetaceae bacterium]